MSDVFGEAGAPFGVGETHEVLMMYTSCSRTDSAIRTMDSPASFLVTVARPKGCPNLIQDDSGLREGLLSGLLQYSPPGYQAG